MYIYIYASNYVYIHMYRTKCPVAFSAFHFASAVCRARDFSVIWNFWFAEPWQSLQSRFPAHTPDWQTWQMQSSGLGCPLEVGHPPGASLRLSERLSRVRARSWQF